MDADPIVLEVRRSRKRFVSRTIATLAPLAVSALIASLFAADARARIVGLLAGFVVIFAISAVYHRRARLFITDERFGRRGWLGTWWTPRSDLSRGLFIESLTGRDDKSTRELVLFDPAGARIVRLSGRVWGNKNVARIAHTLAVPLTRIDRAVTLKEVGIIEPSALRFGERRPYLAIVIFGAGALAVIFTITTIAVNF